MSNIFSFSINGIRSEYFNIIVNSVRRGIAPPIVSRTVQTPGANGLYYYKHRFSERIIEVDITLNELTCQELITQMISISAYLNPSRGLIDLIFDDELDKYYNAVITDTTDIMNQIRAIGKTTLKFLVPEGFSKSINDVSFEILPILPIEFTRTTNAYLRDGTLVTAGNPRYEMNDTNNLKNGITIEEPTSNVLTSNMADFESGLTTGANVLGSSVISISQFHVHTNSFGLKVKTNAIAGIEGFYTDANTVTPSNTYTFSFYMVGSGIVKSLIYEYDAGSNLILSTYSSNINITQEMERYSQTLTLQATTVAVKVGVVTDLIQHAIFYIDSMQLENLPYMTSWINGETTRSIELLKYYYDDTLNGATGTIDFFYKKFGTPGAFATLLDWGQYSVGNTIPRICIYHNTSNGENKIIFNLVNNVTTTLQNLVVTLPYNLVVGNNYYIAIRWNLTGNILTGQIKLDVTDMSTMINYSNTSTTSMNPIPFQTVSPYDEYFYIGSTWAGVFMSNGSINDFRTSNIMRSDTDILYARSSLQPLLKDADTSIKFTFDNTLNPTSISNIGTAPTFPMMVIYLNGAATQLVVTSMPENRTLTMIDSFVTGDKIEIDCYNRIITKNGVNSNSTLSLLSQFPIITGDHYYTVTAV